MFRFCDKSNVSPESNEMAARVVTMTSGSWTSSALAYARQANIRRACRLGPIAGSFTMLFVIMVTCRNCRCSAGLTARPWRAAFASPCALFGAIVPADAWVVASRFSSRRSLNQVSCERKRGGWSRQWPTKRIRFHMHGFQDVDARVVSVNIVMLCIVEFFWNSSMCSTSSKSHHQ